MRHVRAWTDVRRDRDGAVTHLWGTAMDITEQEEYAARLAASEEHFRVAFDNAPIGMSMISLAADDQGHYLRTNAAFQQMLGRDERRAAPASRSATSPTPTTGSGTPHGSAGCQRRACPSLAFEKRYLRARRRDRPCLDHQLGRPRRRTASRST